MQIYPEVMPLVKKIRNQHVLIERQMTELKKNGEEFRGDSIKYAGRLYNNRYKNIGSFVQ